MILLTDKEIRGVARKLLSPELTKYIEESDIAWANLGAETQLKKVVDRLEDALENSFVMAYVGEDEPHQSTIDPITIRELIEEFRQALLKEIE